MTVKEFIQKVEEKNFYCLGDIEDIKGDYKCVSEHQDLDQHHWYSTAINVYKVEDGFVGVWGLFQIFPECENPYDFEIACEAFEMKEIPSVTYVEK